MKITLCESVPPATVEWRGTATFDGFCDRVEAGRDHERRALTDRLQAVDEVLDQQCGKINDLAPARKLQDQIKKVVAPKMDNVDEFTAMALAYVGVCLLDAIERIFDHDELVDRLNGRIL